MKNSYAILFLAALLNASQSLCQPANERVALFTDRNLYISGESIHFSALIESENDGAALSRILYCELITPEGKSMASGKYAAVSSIATGRLDVPSDLITGVYYLKAYTRLMRNEGPVIYSYNYIRVVNPDLAEVRTGSATGTGEKEISKISGLTMNVPAEVFSGDTVNIIVQDSSKCESLRNLTISVIPEQTLSNYKVSPVAEVNVNDTSILPETRGILISGIVRDRSGLSSIPGIRVNLSITGEGRDFISSVTGPDGRFIFSLPDYTGNRDIFLSADSGDSLDAQILVDNDFCTLPVSLPDEEFSLTNDERETALKMAVNYRLEKYFRPESSGTREDEMVETTAFYGKPDEVIYIDDYIRLPTMEEYFNGLPGSVKVRKRSGHKYFKVLGTQPELMEIDPLVMIDLVVIDDPEKILALNPTDIERIDIVNSVYAKGSELYGGIVNIISRRKDFAGISLPSSGVFINYSFITRPEVPSSEETVSSPDTRNTVLWTAPDDTGNCRGASFIAPETPGKYIVVIRGVNREGKEEGGTASFSVRNR